MEKIKVINSRVYQLTLLYFFCYADNVFQKQVNSSNQGLAS